MPRFYLGEDQKLSISVGPVLNYISAARLKYSMKKPNQVEQSGERNLLDKGLSEEEKIHQLGWGIVMGLDYEFDSGVTLGCAYNVGLSNILPQQLHPISAKKFSGGLTLGFNMAKLLQ